jgi:hypothetical protein
VIIFNFDVLAKPGQEFGARLPDPDGIRLWMMMHEQSLGRLAVVKDTLVKTDHLEHWMRVNGIKAAVYEQLDVESYQDKAEKVQRLAMLYGRSDWYIDIDPRTCALTMAMGMPTLLVAHPYVVRPEWVKEDVGPTPWDELVAEVDRQNDLRSARTWGDAPTFHGDDD